MTWGYASESPRRVWVWVGGGVQERERQMTRIWVWVWVWVMVEVVDGLVAVQLHVTCYD